jgi:hypothetical protein
MLVQQEQDSNPGGWRKEKFIMLVGQHQESPKWHQLRDFYSSECGSKQLERTKADMAVSLSLGGYNISY